jgi:hypothetical protein
MHTEEHYIEQAVYDQHWGLYFRFIERGKYHPDYITSGLKKIMDESNYYHTNVNKTIVCQTFIIVTYVNSVFVTQQLIYIWSRKYYKRIDKHHRSCDIL